MLKNLIHNLTKWLKNIHWLLSNKKKCHMCNRYRRFIFYEKTEKAYVKKVTGGVNYCCKRCVKKEKINR